MSNSVENVENAKDNSASAHSLAEILSQPECWKRCLDELDRSQKLKAVRERFPGTEWLFIGCGSSYYVALSAAADLLVELNLKVPELAQLSAYLFAVQRLGLFTGLKKGLDPDSPRNLSRVVILDDENSRKRRENAAF